MSDRILLSPRDAQKISGVLELHISSGMVSKVPDESKDRLKEEIQELNKIQKKIESQLDVSGNR